MVTIEHYHQFVELMGDFSAGYTGWPNDSIKIILMDDGNHTRLLTNTLLSEVTGNQLSTQFGYTQDTEVVATVTSSFSTTTWTLDATVDASWTASGGSIGPSTDAVIYDDTLTTPLNGLMFDIDFEASETAGSGTDFIIAWHANGICTII